MNLYEKLHILQLAKDVFRGFLLLTSVCLVWWFNNQIIIACGIVLLFLDLIFAALHIIYKKFTFADLKDFFSVLCLLIYVILTLFISDKANKYRVVYCVFYAFFSVLDLSFVIIHISGLFLLYTDRISVELHNSAARAFNLDNSPSSPY